MAKNTPKSSTKVAPVSKPVAPAAKVAAPAPKPASMSAAPKAPYKPSQSEIAARAYEIFQREGGNETENWLRAERELTQRGPRA